MRDSLSPAQRVALAALRLYKWLISPLFTGSCRFMPSCSEYAREAIVRFGVVQGSVLAARRLARIRPGSRARTRPPVAIVHGKTGPARGNSLVRRPVRVPGDLPAAQAGG